MREFARRSIAIEEYKYTCNTPLQEFLITPQHFQASFKENSHQRL